MKVDTTGKPPSIPVVILVGVLSFIVVVVLGGCASRPTEVASASSKTAPVAKAEPRAQAIADNTGPDRIFFEYDSWTLSAEAEGVLRRQADWITKNPSSSILIEGHCDERGTREYNLALGERRANAVREYLTSLGVATARLKTVSYGKERPEITGSSEESYTQNRRAVLVANVG